MALRTWLPRETVLLNKTRTWLSARRARGTGSDVAIPAERMTRIYVSLKRRLSDQVEDVLEEACVIGDLQTAQELLQVLEYMHARQPRSIGHDRRVQVDRLASLRTEVVRQQQLRAARSARIRLAGA